VATIALVEVVLFVVGVSPVDREEAVEVCDFGEEGAGNLRWEEGVCVTDVDEQEQWNCPEEKRDNHFGH